MFLLLNILQFCIPALCISQHCVLKALTRSFADIKGHSTILLTNSLVEPHSQLAEERVTEHL
jgi:hypothetical protein